MDRDYEINEMIGSLETLAPHYLTELEFHQVAETFSLTCNPGPDGGCHSMIIFLSGSYTVLFMQKKANSGNMLKGRSFLALNLLNM